MGIGCQREVTYPLTTSTTFWERSSEASVSRIRNYLSAVLTHAYNSLSIWCPVK